MAGDIPSSLQQLWLACAQRSTRPPALWEGSSHRHSWIYLLLTQNVQTCIPHLELRPEGAMEDL